MMNAVKANAAAATAILVVANKYDLCSSQDGQSEFIGKNFYSNT